MHPQNNNIAEDVYKRQDDKASRALLEYPWPGNLRQMKNMVRRATLLAQGKFITINELNELTEPATAIIGIPLRNEEAEKHQIIEACLLYTSSPP